MTVEERLAKLEAARVYQTVYVVVRDMYPAAVFVNRADAERQCEAWAGGRARCLANACIIELALLG